MRRVSLVAALCLLVLIAAPLAYAVQATGRVVDTNGNGQARVKVEFGDRATAWTDRNGSFGVDVPAGSYQVTTSQGNKSQSFPVKVEASGKMSPSTLVVKW